MRACPFCGASYHTNTQVMIVPDGSIVEVVAGAIECDCGATWAMDDSQTHGRPKKHAKKSA